MEVAAATEEEETVEVAEAAEEEANEKSDVKADKKADKEADEEANEKSDQKADGKADEEADVFPIAVHEKAKFLRSAIEISPLEFQG